MRHVVAARLALVAALMSQARPTAAAPQPRDYFLDAPRAGTFVHGDVAFVGAQASVEHRAHLEEDVSMLQFRASGLAALGYGEVSAHADVRLMFLQVGGSTGLLWAQRTYSGNDVSSTARRARDESEGETSKIPWAETHARLVVPMSALFLIASLALRWSDQAAETFDMVHANVHDGGRLLRLDAILFFRDPSFGAFGPTIRYMSLPRHGGREGEVVYGFTFATRPEIKAKDDLFLLQLLVKPGDQEFGFHQLRVPVWFLLAYRASFRL